MTPHCTRSFARFSVVFFASLAAALPLFGQARVTLTPKDGHPLVGSFVKPAGAPKGGVVLLPAARGARVAYDPLLARLAQAGLAAIAIDPRAEAVAVESAPSRPADGGGARQDLEAALEYLVAQGAPVEKLAIGASGSATSVALGFAARTGARVKALVLLSPGRDEPVPPKELLQEITPRPILVLATEDEAAKGAQLLKEVIPGVELQLHRRPARVRDDDVRPRPGRRVDDRRLDRSHARHALGDRDPRVEARLPRRRGDAGRGARRHHREGAARRRIRRHRSGSRGRGKRLLFGFDVPEPCVRLNEVVIYIEGSGKGGRVIDQVLLPDLVQSQEPRAQAAPRPDAAA